MANNNFFTDKFFDSPVYRALQAPYNERMARERAASNPLAPSQGGSWPSTRPVSTALTPQNYTPNIPPHIPNDPRRATADMRVPGMVGPAPGAMQPFPLAYPDNAPIDITVRGGNVANVPLPQRRPWDAPTSMDLAAIAARDAAMQPPVASAYAPPPAQNPAVAAALSASQGLSPLSASERIKQDGYGLNSTDPNKLLTPSQEYDAKNAFATGAAQGQDRSGIGTDGYVRNASGQVIGRDAKYQGLNPDQMYNTISGRAQDDSWKTSFSKDQGLEAKLRGTGITPEQYMQGIRDGTYSGLGDVPRTGGQRFGGGIATSAPVTLGPMQRPAQTRFGGTQPPARTGGQMLSPLQTNGLSGRKMRF